MRIVKIEYDKEAVYKFRNERFDRLEWGRWGKDKYKSIGLYNEIKPTIILNAAGETIQHIQDDFFKPVEIEMAEGSKSFKEHIDAAFFGYDRLDELEERGRDIYNLRHLERSLKSNLIPEIVEQEPVTRFSWKWNDSSV